MWIDFLLVTAIVLGGLQAVRRQRLLSAVLWLAVTSALIATALYRSGAPEVAAMELSVGAGLVTVMFVFSIAIAGEDAMEARSLVPPVLAWLLILSAAVLLGRSILPVETVDTAVVEPPFSEMLWEARGMDVLVQIGLIFAGVLGILGLLTEPAVEPKRETVLDRKMTAQPANISAAGAVAVVTDPLDRSVMPAGIPVLEDERI